MSDRDVQKQQFDKFDYECSGHYPVIAAIDLGTNSCRLLVARVNVAGIRTNYFRSKPKPTSWKVVDSFAKVVRLGEGLYSNDELSLDAIERAMDALAICRSKLDRYKLDGMRAVATEACRRATNKHILVERASKELGLNIEVIEAEEEARLALKGCSAILNPNIPYGIVFDIGGGSTEVILVSLNKEGKRKLGYSINYDVIDSISVPYGVVTTTEAISGNNSQTREILQQKIADMISEFVDKNNILELINSNQLQMTGSSGTVTTLAAYHLGLQQYERRLVDGITITYDDIDKVINKIFEMSKEGTLENSSFGFGRIDYILTGSIILQSICKAIPANVMRIADRGVREGILIDLMLDVIKV